MPARSLAAAATWRDARRRSWTPAPANSWSVTHKGHIIEVGYGCGSTFPQYAALHTDCGFLRLNYGPDSAWGTSIALLPALWVAGTYYQGAPITVASRNKGKHLLVLFTGSIADLRVHGHIRLIPPAPDLIHATVMVTVDGNVKVDHRPGEAFKPVSLSSMHISADLWDARFAQIDSRAFPIPAGGWLIQPPTVGRRFSLRAGSSTWKTNAPSVEILLDEDRDITGWKADSSDPDDDNLGFWAATDHVLRLWQYAVIAKR